ncbi:hypothetical protein C8R42DRAFT_637088 [Lentinula raphanica]|nr:hypothetical protein C8R42DRAFT_637088 [Lentinula raphanica]
MNFSVISISDDEDSTSESSLTSTTNSLFSNQMSQVERAACSPPGVRVVCTNQEPGCYRDWADASGRVTNYPAPHPPEIPKTPPPTTPPPAKINTVSMTPSSPIGTSNRINPSAFPPLVSPVPTSPSPSHVDPSLRAGQASTPQRRNRIWAIHFPRFNSVVPSSAQADKILARAVQEGDEVEIREVDGVAQAQEWFGTLSLDE